MAGNKRQRPLKRGNRSSASRAAGLEELVEGNVTHLVRLKIAGRFESAAAIVERQSFPLDATWKGARPVHILPPTLDVEAHVWTRVPTKFEVAVTLNGVEKKQSGVTKYPGRNIQFFSFPLSEFGLGTAIASARSGR